MVLKLTNMARAAIKKYCRLSARFPLLAFIGVFIAGILFWGAFNTSLELTNSEAFCISCHEMENNVYQEYKTTIHFSNRTGVRATCPDCHVPKEWHHMVVRKVSATNELFHKIIGSIDTKEKFESKRLQLASYVWEDMQATDSRECRNCHAFGFMEIDKQQPGSRKAHQRAVEQGRTCIACHMGVAHKIPKDFDKDGKLHAAYKKNNRPCADCHTGIAQGEGW